MLTQHLKTTLVKIEMSERFCGALAGCACMPDYLSKAAVVHIQALVCSAFRVCMHAWI